ncbi:MAG: hypothetical protein CV087_19660, partial [Candidatus Brocadia sp. WS118]
YGLTLRIGHLLSDSFEKNLVTADNLLALSGILWFIEGNIPPKYQNELRGYLAHRFPRQHSKVLHDLQQLMEDNPPPENSAAWMEYQINLAFLRVGTSARPDEADLNLLHAVVRRSRWPERLGETFVVPMRWEEMLRRLGLEEVDDAIQNKAADLFFQLLCTPSDLQNIPAEQLASSQEWAKKWLYQNDPITPLVLESAEGLELKFRVMEIKIERLLLNRQFFGELKEQLAKYPDLMPTDIGQPDSEEGFDSRRTTSKARYSSINEKVLPAADTNVVEDAIYQLIGFLENSSSHVLPKARELYGLFHSVLRKDEAGNVPGEVVKVQFEETIQRLIALLKDFRTVAKREKAKKHLDGLIAQFDKGYIPPEQEVNPLLLPYQGKKALIIGMDNTFCMQIGSMLNGLGFTTSTDHVITKRNLEGVNVVFLATLDLTLQKLLIQKIRRRDDTVPIVTVYEKYPLGRNIFLGNNNIYVMLGSVQPENMANVLSDIFVKKGKSARLSLYENIFASVSDEKRALRNRPLICNRCNEIREDLSRCERPYCEFEVYRDRMLDVFGREMPKKYYISLIGGVNASKTTYLLTLVDTLLNDSKAKKALKKLGIEDIHIIDPNSQEYFNAKIEESKAGRLALTYPYDPLQFISIILYTSNKKAIEITLFNSSGEKIEDQFLSENYRTASHELKGVGALYFVDPREDSILNKLLANPKDMAYGPCKDFNIIEFIHKVLQFVSRGINVVNNPIAICISKFDLLMDRIPSDLPDTPFVNPNSLDLFRDINRHSKQLAEFLEYNSSTIQPPELQSKFKSIKYFAVAPYGSDKYPAIWEKRNPQGILAPFLWILKELKIIS